MKKPSVYSNFWIMRAKSGLFNIQDYIGDLFLQFTK